MFWVNKEKENVWAPG